MSLSFPADHSVAFTSLTMTPKIYLNRLVDRLTALGGKMHRHHLPSLGHLGHPSTTALIGDAPPLSIIVCVGIGAVMLGGVEDSTVYPTRGQVVKVRAPWVRSGWTRQIGSLDGGEGGERTYVIPRPDGEVILGGTREENDWYPYPREETANDILRRSLEICPILRPPHCSAPALSSVEGLLSGLKTDGEASERSSLSKIVLSHLVGFRPSRKQGVRLEAGPALQLGGGETQVVYNYGHGGAGWQSCWGTAEDATELVVHALS
jgi:glycine/D-amino acid oxidase-like deaminating enzyme